MVHLEAKDAQAYQEYRYHPAGLETAEAPSLRGI
jgi:hypothetical protein